MSWFTLVAFKNVIPHCLPYTQRTNHVQVFGELAVLDSDTLSPVSAISSTAVELYCFDINTMSQVQW